MSLTGIDPSDDTLRLRAPRTLLSILETIQQTRAETPDCASRFVWDAGSETVCPDDTIPMEMHLELRYHARLFASVCIEFDDPREEPLDPTWYPSLAKFLSAQHSFADVMSEMVNLCTDLQREDNLDQYYLDELRELCDRVDQLVPE